MGDHPEASEGFLATAVGGHDAEARAVSQGVSMSIRTGLFVLVLLTAALAAEAQQAAKVYRVGESYRQYPTLGR
jgi:hypothetical protein